MKNRNLKQQFIFSEFLLLFKQRCIGLGTINTSIIRNIKCAGVFLLPFILTLSMSCQQQQVVESNAPVLNEQPNSSYNPYQNSDITVEPFKIDSVDNNGSNGWGYDILIDGQLYIHQPNIPAIMGNSGFSSEEKARQAGEFVVEKIKKNILPPTLTVEELEVRGLLD